MAYPGGVKDNVGNEGMGQQVIHGIFKTFILGFTQNYIFLEFQETKYLNTFYYITQGHVMFVALPAHILLGPFFVLETRDFKEFAFDFLIYKGLSKDFKLETDRMRMAILGETWGAETGGDTGGLETIGEMA